QHLAARIKELKLAGLASFLLEAHRPLQGLIAHAYLMLEPGFTSVLRPATSHSVRALFESEDGFKRLSELLQDTGEAS
ncbi:MAG: hypothetical protein DCC75_07875, partial [Proteobacteria bacterium]